MEKINKGKLRKPGAGCLQGGQQNKLQSCLKLNSSIAPRSVFFIVRTTPNFKKFSILLFKGSEIILVGRRKAETFFSYADNVQ